MQQFACSVDELQNAESENRSQLRSIIGGPEFGAIGFAGFLETVAHHLWVCNNSLLLPQQNDAKSVGPIHQATLASQRRSAGIGDAHRAKRIGKQNQPCDANEIHLFLQSWRAGQEFEFVPGGTMIPGRLTSSHRFRKSRREPIRLQSQVPARCPHV